MRLDIPIVLGLLAAAVIGIEQREPRFPTTSYGSASSMTNQMFTPI